MRELGNHLLLAVASVAAVSVYLPARKATTIAPMRRSVVGLFESQAVRSLIRMRRFAPQCYIRKHGSSCLGRARMHGNRVGTAR